MSAAEQFLRLQRGSPQVIEQADLLKKLESGRPLRVKYGIDPTGIDVHLGHTVPLRKLRQFQNNGHQAVLIIGNYTALVGDPSGRDETRARLTPEQVEANARDYIAQVGKVIDLSKTEIRFNGEWFSRFSFLDVMALTSRITVQRMLERDDFTKRFRAEPSVPISLHECLYPLMQGHDSVEVRADVELGGTEQLFNLMMGRRLQEDAGQPPQVCMTVPILRGLDGVRRMGKSLGNYIGVGMPAQEQFDRTMSIPDSLLDEWFLLLTDRPAEEFTSLTTSNPMEAKKTLAADIVGFYYGADAARLAREGWEKRFSRKEDPDVIPDADVASSSLKEGRMGAAALVKALGLAPSGNEARRLIQNGGVTIGPDRTKLDDPNAALEVATGLVVRVGSRKIVRVRVV
ncbi:MAG: tyrosine--tRNA ligase [Gemmataceae bacterium]|nr:tyrosine--tRNA ligase [Gemmataceae bacterium]